MNKDNDGNDKIEEDLCCNAMSPLNNSFYFVVREDKVEEFLNLKPNKEKLERIKKLAKRVEKQIGVHE